MTPTKQEKNEGDKYKTLPICTPPPRVLVTSLVDYDTHHSRASTRHDAAAWTSPFAMLASTISTSTNRLTLSSLSSRSLAYDNDRNKTKNNEDADPLEISFSSSSGVGSSSTTMSAYSDDDGNNKSSTASSSSSLLLENGRNNSNYYTCNSTTTTTQKMKQVPSILKPSLYHPIKRHRCNNNQGYYYKDGIWAVTMLKPTPSSTMDEEYDWTATATCSNSSKKSRTSY